jgi:uncharacterized membrane protein YfhO
LINPTSSQCHVFECFDSNQLPPFNISPDPSTQRTHVSKAPIQLIFTYDWEKKPWIFDVTTQFNTGRYKTSDGQTIYVKHIPMGMVHKASYAG